MPSIPKYTALRDHGIENVWCSPEQDGQYTFKPARLTRAGGAVNSVEIMRVPHRLPVNGARFHVFQIGAISPSRLNIKTNSNAWVNVASWCRLNNMDITIYTNNGYVLPREGSWFKITDNGAIVFAVRSFKEISQSATELVDVAIQNDVFIKFYKNAFFRSIRSGQDGYTHQFTSLGRFVETATDISALQTFVSDLATSPGVTYGFFNGKFRYPVRPADIVAGKYIELIHDTTVDDVFETTLEDKRVFTSTLDSVKKYVIRGTTVSRIRYLDDCDFWLVKPQQGYSEGLIVHRNARSNIRMLTPGDYSVSIPLLRHLRTSSTPNLGNGLEDLKIITFRRKSGFSRPLVPDAHRLDVISSGLDYTIGEDIRPLNEPNHPVSIWQAAALEQSPYSALMGARQEDISGTTVAEAYGYNGASKLVGDGLIKATTPVVTLPLALQENSTVYEYDADGILLGSFYHPTGVDYALREVNTDFIEAVSGQGYETTEHIHRLPTVLINEGVEYRVYRKDAGSDDWMDVTGEDGAWTLDTVANPPVLRISDTSGVDDYLIISDDKFVDREFIFPPGTAEFKMTIGGYPDAGSFEALEIPTAEIDVWVNGHSLTPGKDFIVVWPEITLISAEYLDRDPSNINTVRLRARGFPQPSDKLMYQAPLSTGFIAHGVMTNNSHYDIHDNKVLRYIVNGRSYITSDIEYIFDENFVHPDPSTPAGKKLYIVNDADHPLNGKPYSINRNYVSLAPFIEGSTRDLKTKDDLIDEEVSQYFALNLNTEYDTSGPSFILRPYELFSPFLARIIIGCISMEDGLRPSEIPDNLVKGDIDGVLAPYMEILDVDPTQDHIFDLYQGQQIAILPHPFTGDLTVNIHQWRLIKFIVENYLNDRVQLSLGQGMRTVVTDPPENQW